eukprot:1161639-Pelagomonas_calceolata.AAC.11
MISCKAGGKWSKCAPPWNPGTRRLRKEGGASLSPVVQDTRKEGRSDLLKSRGAVREEMTS